VIGDGYLVSPPNSIEHSRGSDMVLSFATGSGVGFYATYNSYGKR